MGKRRFAPVTIPGVLDWRDVRDAVVEQQPLRNRHAFREQARCLADMGLDPAAIGRALGLRRRVVADLLGLPSDD